MKNVPENFAAPLRPPGTGGGTGGFAPAVGMDYAALVQRFLRNWIWFVLAIGVALTLAFLYLRYTTPIYEAKMSMLIEEQSSGTPGLSTEAITQELGFQNSYVIDNEIYMLRSNYMMERVVRALGLHTAYIHQGAVRNTEVYQPKDYQLVRTDTVREADPELVKYGAVFVRFDSPEEFSLVRGDGDTTTMRYNQSFPIGTRSYRLERVAGREIEDAVSLYEIEVMDPALVAKKYAGELTVTQVERSGVVNLSLTDPVAKKARDILNTLVAVYEQQILEQQSQTGAKTLAFLTERLDFVTQELDAVETSMAQFRQSANLNVDLQTQGADYLARVNTVDQLLAEQQVRRGLLQDIESTLTEGNDYRALPLASEVIPPVLTELITQYNEIVFMRDQTLEGVTLNHPTVASFTEQLDVQKSTIMRSVNVLKQESDERIANLKARLAPIERKLSRLPANEQRFLEIMRDQTIKSNLYTYLLTRREEAALTVAAQVSNTRILDRASSGSNPISPYRPMIYLMAFGMGLIVPAGAIFLRELFGKTVVTEKEITDYLPYSIVGRVVTSSKKESLQMIENNRSALAESFRQLRTNLGFLLPDGPAATVLITSSVSGEGKSFISSKLSAALALTKKRVVVIGLDMRKPKLAEMVLDESKTNRNVGLSNYLVGKSTYEEIITPTPYERLWIIPSGPLPPNPAELLTEERMGTLMERLRQDYDVIILDAPPVGIVTDGLLMKDHVDVTLFVARIGVTPKKSMQYINELATSGNLHRINLVINGIDPKAAYGYGYGYYE
ncbi:Tyrosine-protein kinase wzc [Neolewinella maritima]|uniref:non-specific protein-tyrosine kinase n=1 Tax=Neolewinella maritima TaxID=1383882 RepID=A0ABN8F2Z2_9BACT|nr:tyrosine-protein kinase [Neolewinella maritima]CAH1001343.1 Tyrosine-protein kinase wzc [Neolewinella maritima]